MLPSRPRGSTRSTDLTEELTPLLEALPHSNLKHLDLSANGIAPDSALAEHFRHTCRAHYIALDLRDESELDTDAGSPESLV